MVDIENNQENIDLCEVSILTYTKFTLRLHIYLIICDFW